MPDASTARSWIASSTLPEEDKAALNRFVDRFPALDFARDDETALRRYEQTDEITLPPWYREVRATLAPVAGGAQLRVGGFSWDESPRADEQAGHWYEVTPGYVNDEDRDTLRDLGRLYPVAQWFASYESILAVDLDNPDDHRLFEFALEDLWDDEAKGDPVRDTTYFAFASYSDFLDHVVAVKLPGGDVVEARAER